MSYSRVGLGCNQLGRRVDRAGARELVDAALRSGMTFFDTADVYGSRPGESERLLGAALDRKVTLATKFGFDVGGPEVRRGSREYVRWAIEGSLRRLGVDTVDLLQYHKPDGVTPIEETLGAMAELVDEGKVRALGVSQHSADQVRAAHAAAGERLATVQDEYNLLERGAETELLPECERLGLGFLPFYPLARGLLTGMYRRGEPAPEGTRLHGRDVADGATFDRLEALARFAADRAIEPIDVAIGWLAAQPAVASVIAGATKPEQVERNARAADWRPSQDDRAELDGIFPPGA